MRYVIPLLFLVAPAHAWEFSPTPICTLSETTQDTKTEITFDGEIYTLRLTDPDGWPVAPIFAIQFAPNGPVISTSRHQVQGDTLIVSDSGFGNVLTGLENNQRAYAQTGSVIRPIDLTGATEPVRAFRACDPLPPSA